MYLEDSVCEDGDILVPRRQFEDGDIHVHRRQFEDGDKPNNSHTIH